MATAYGREFLKTYKMKIHYRIAINYSLRVACSWTYGDNQKLRVNSSVDKIRVTCGNCRQTKVFKSD